MVIGSSKVVLLIDDAFSLKEKRHIVKSLIERIKSKFNATVAEVDFNDKWKSAAIGVACVSNDTGHADSIITSIVNFIENDGRAEVVDVISEMIHVNN